MHKNVFFKNARNKKLKRWTETLQAKILILAAAGVVGGTILGVAIFGLKKTIDDIKRSDEIYAKANEVYVLEGTETEQTDVAKEEVATKEYDTKPFSASAWWGKTDVDVKKVNNEHEDVVAWIYFENGETSYPVLFSGDNEKYLKTTYNGEQAMAGSIFMDGVSSVDFSDPHTIIYGHNMKNGSMLGNLKEYKKGGDKYFQNNQYFQIFTKDKVYRYQIYAYEEVPDNALLYSIKGKNPVDMWAMVSNLAEQSIGKTNVPVDASDHIVTLSTCTNNKSMRMIVSAKRVGERVKTESDNTG